MTLANKTNAKVVTSEISGIISEIIPNPALKEAFDIFVAGFKIGAIYGFESRKINKSTKQLIRFLETKQARLMIMALLEKGENGA